MVDTQSFRLTGESDIRKIPLHNVDGKNIIYWFDIQEVFPGVKHVENGEVVVPKMRDSHKNIIKPYRIEHCPNVVLEVFMSTTVKHVHVDSPMPITNPGFEGTVLHKLDGLHDQGDVTQRIAQEVWELTKQMNDRLILIQSKTEAILTQNYELLEYTIPRLFIVLPEEPTSWDPKTMLRTKFRLRFICECGEHTKAPGSKIPHHLHLANHEGYVINKPTEFFKKYGPFLMLMLKMIKVGTSIAGHVVPALASLKVVDILDSAQSTIDSVTSKVIEGVDYSLKYLEEIRTLIEKLDSVDVDGNAIMSQQDLATYFAGAEGLEGVDLRQLGSYLSSNSSDNLLGNLYRMTTKDGYVKWVCRHHYRAGYQEAHTQKLRDVVELAGGVFDEQLGSIKLTLKSSFAAAEFYEALSKAKAGVYDLDITFDWDCSTADLEAFEKVLKVSSVSILRLDLDRFKASIASKLLSTSTRYEILVRIIEHTNMKKIHIVLSKDFVKLSSLQPKRSTHLHKLSIEMTPRASDFQVLVKSLKTNNPLTTLNLKGNSIGNEGALALSEALKTNTTLTTLDLQSNSIGNEGAQALSEALKTNTTLATLSLWSNSIGKEGALALSEALKTNTTLTTLNLNSNSIGKEGTLALSEALKTNTTLTTLDLRYNSIWKEDALALSEALKNNTTLTTLNLSYNSIGKEGALALSDALKTNTTLTTLDLGNNWIGNEGGLALSEALKTNTTLTTLNLGHNSIWNEGGLALSEALKTNTTLTTLDLRYNSIGNEGALALSEALKTNTTLTTLNLQRNSIGNEGGLALSEALKNNTTLTTLNLQFNPIGKGGALALSEALKTNTTLTTLDLYSNSIGNVGALALSEALKTNTTLTTLNLWCNSIGNEGALALSEALKTNTTLTTLNLNDNSIGKEGALALSEVLKTNTTLTTLNLQRNSIGNEGGLALSKALKTNTTLTTLNLGHNSIGNEGALALSEALKTNTTLTTLDLRWNLIGKEGALALSEVLKTNTTLTSLDWYNN